MAGIVGTLSKIQGLRRGARGSLAGGLAVMALALGGCKEDEPTSDAGETGGETGSATSTSGADESSGGSTGAAIDPNAPTWYQDIAPMVITKCGGCHREDGIAPFSLTDYESAAPYAVALAASVEERTMPPFAAADTEECAFP